MNRIRILITETCNANCPNCFNNKFRQNKELSVNQIDNIASSLAMYGVNTVYVEGGEPTIHSSFTLVMNSLQKRIDSIVLFTNALSSSLMEFLPREKDGIVYNFNFITKGFDEKKFLMNKPGKRSVIVQITKHTNVNELIERIRHFNPFFKQENYTIILTLDCTMNVFNNAEELAIKWNQFTAACIINGWNLKIDHGFPLCLKEKYKCMMIECYQGRVEDVSENHGLYWCDYKRAGLIDAHMNLRYCNNYYHESIPISENGQIIDQTRIEDFLIESQKKKEERLPIVCKQCKEYILGNCNATCFGCN